MPYWDERFAAMGKQYPQVTTDQYHIGVIMLDHLGEAAAAAAIVRAIEGALEPGSDAPRTPDIGGKARTADLGKAIAAAV